MPNYKVLPNRVFVENHKQLRDYIADVRNYKTSEFHVTLGRSLTEEFNSWHADFAPRLRKFEDEKAGAVIANIVAWGIPVLGATTAFATAAYMKIRSDELGAFDDPNFRVLSRHARDPHADGTCTINLGLDEKRRFYNLGGSTLYRVRRGLMDQPPQRAP